jgi:hypothetical protein
LKKIVQKSRSFQIIEFTKFRPNFILIDFEQKVKREIRERTPDEVRSFVIALAYSSFSEQGHTMDKTFHYVKSACIQDSIERF